MQRQEELHFIEQLEQLPEQVFIKLFRNLLNREKYPYSDEEVIAERYNAILVLLSDISRKSLKQALARLRK